MPKKWFINLAASLQRGRSKNHGPEIPLVAKRNFGHGRAAVGNRAVEWRAVVTPDAHTDFAAPATFNPAESREGAGGAFETKFKPPPVGGRTYTVTAAKKAGQGANNVSLTESYVAWRRLYYTVNYMNAACKTLFESAIGPAKTRFEELFISLKQYQSLQAAGGDEPVTKRGGDAQLIGKHAGTMDKAKTHLRFVVVNDLADDHSKDVRFQVTSAGDAAGGVGVAAGVLTFDTKLEPNTVTRGFVLDKLKITPGGAPVDVDAGRLSRTDEFTAAIDLGHGSMAAAKSALDAKNAVVFSGKLRGRKSAARIDRSHPLTELELVAANDAAAPVVVAGKAQGHLAGGRVLVKSLVAGSVFAEAAPDVSVEVEGSAKRTIDAAGLTIDRAAGTCSFALTSPEEALVERGAKVTAAVTLHLRADVVLAAEADHPFELQLQYDVGTMRTTATARGITATMNGTRIDVTATDVLLSATAIVDVRTAIHGAALDLTARKADATLVTWTKPATTQVLRLDLNAAGLTTAKAALDAGQKVDVELTYKYLQSFAGGYVTGSNVVLLTTFKVKPDEAAAVTTKRVTQTILHEIGHALGITKRSEPKLDGTTLAHANYYTDDQGGQGPHCHENAMLVASAVTSSGQAWKPDNTTNAVCNMLHYIVPDRMDGHFCASCSGMLLRNKVELPR